MKWLFYIFIISYLFDKISKLFKFAFKSMHSLVEMFHNTMVNLSYIFVVIYIICFLFLIFLKYKPKNTFINSVYTFRYKSYPIGIYFFLFCIIYVPSFSAYIICSIYFY
jgi:hypothetical protein